MVVKWSLALGQMLLLVLVDQLLNQRLALMVLLVLLVVLLDKQQLNQPNQPCSLFRQLLLNQQNNQLLHQLYCASTGSAMA